MSEENLNNNGGEETAALFVSAQKRKKAEEEARRKAEEEKAKRDAAEAEVLKMEQEVEERKRKAEEERLAQEQAERELQAKEAGIAGNIKEKAGDLAGKAGELAHKAGSMATKGSGDSTADAVKNPKLPLFIGIGAAAVVLVIVLAVVLGGKGKSSKIDYASLNCNAEYKVQKEGYDVMLYYPEDLYGEITEEEKDAGGTKFLSVTFNNVNKKAPALSVTIYTVNAIPESIQLTCDKQVESIKTIGQTYLSGSTIKEESLCDLAAENPGAYFYKASYQKEKNAGAISTLLKTNSAGNVDVVISDFVVKGEDPAEPVALRDLYESKNVANALKTPGGNPPTSYDWDGTLEFSEIDFKLPVPRDRFKETTTSSDGTRFFWDDNGCFVVVAALFQSSAEDFNLTTDSLPAVMTAFEGMSEKGLSENMNISNRMFLSKKETPYYSADFMAEYKDVINGITYWEMDWCDLWVNNGDDIYILSLYIYAPNNNKEVYKQIFEKSLQSL